MGKSEFRQNNSNKIIAVVVTYNRKVLLKECLSALLNIQDRNLDILIVDNGSTDDSLGYIANIINSSNKVKYINTGCNLGGAGGFNLGIKEALLNGYEYIWIMDDDCIVNSNSLSYLKKFAAKNKNFGYLSSKVLWKDGSLCKMNIPRKTLSKEVVNVNKCQKIILASFVSMFLNSKAVVECGLPIKDFFIWGDDWEYSARIAKKFNCYFVPDSVVLHKCKKNEGVNLLTEKERLDRYFYAYRNEGYFYKHQGLKGKIYWFLKYNYHRLRLLTIKNGREKIEIINKGLNSQKNFNPKIEYIFPENFIINVCEFFGEPIAYGGQEMFMLNMLNSFVDQNIKYSIVTPFDMVNGSFNTFKEIKLVSYKYKFDSIFRKLYIVKAFKKFIKSNKVDVLHIQSGSTFVLFKVASIAKKNGVKKVIIHSHCAGKLNLKYKLIKKYSDKKMDKYVDTYFACSYLAAKWKFPISIIENNKYYLIKNGINVKNFTFNLDIRNFYREKFGLSNSFVICHVGRFSEQKNHIFLTNVCKRLSSVCDNFKVILVGDGELKQQIINKIREDGIYDKFIFLEKRNDINNIMMASDVFVLPSLYEGLAITSIESQCTGLFTLCSDLITKETEVTDIIKFISIDNPDEWVNAILEVKKLKYDRTKYSKVVEDAGYNSKMSARFLENIYRGLDKI